MLDRLFTKVDRFLDIVESLKGLPVIIGLLLVIVSLIAQFTDSLAFMTQGNWLLHVGVIIGLGGLLFTDTL